MGVGVWRWRWTAAVAVVDNREGVQWWRWRWCSMAAAAFDGVRWRRRWTTTRGQEGGTRTGNSPTSQHEREGGAARGQQEMMARQPAGATRKREATRRENKTTRGQRVERRRNTPRFRGHGDSQTVVFFPPKTPPCHFHHRKILCDEPSNYNIF